MLSKALVFVILSGSFIILPMVAEILRTKLYIPPPRPELVSRPRLRARLNEGLHRKLTLVSAPAGFGKTTLVSEWLSDFGLDSAASELPIQNPPVPGTDAKSPRAGDWRKIRNLKAAWLSLDEGDNDLARFLTYLIAAVQQIDPNIGQTAQEMVRSPQLPGLEAVITALINDLAAVPDRLVLVLDDYHSIDNPVIDEALALLLAHLPPVAHLVITSRVDPGLPLPRLRARGQLTELRAADLRFTTEEAAQFLNRVTGLSLPAETVAALEARTEGWIAGLQLAALSMQGGRDTAGFIAAFTGSHRYIIDYLADEVLDQQPEAIKMFLLRSSILNRLSGPLCDAVVGEELMGRWGDGEMGRMPEASPDSSLAEPVGSSLSPASGQAVLEYLEQANLFIIPLDDERRWYRYHHLFADLLRQRLHQHLARAGRTNGAALAELHRRASNWYVQEATDRDRAELVNEALYHAGQARDFSRAAELVRTYIGMSLMRGNVTSVMQWLAKLPPEMVEADARLSIGQAWVFYFSQRPHAAERYLQAAEQQALAGIVWEPDNPDQILGEVNTLRAWVARSEGAYERAIQLFRQALAQLPEKHLVARGLNLIFLANTLHQTGDLGQAGQLLVEGISVCKAAGNILAAVGAIYALAHFQMKQGHLRQAGATLVDGLRWVRKQNLENMPSTAELYLGLGELDYEQNRLEAAENYLRTVLEVSKRGLMITALPAAVQLNLARVRLAQGDLAAARRCLEEAEAAGREWEPSPDLADLFASRSRIWLDLAMQAVSGQLVEEALQIAQSWYRQVDLNLEGGSVYARSFQLVTAARFLIVETQLRRPTEGAALSEAMRLLAKLSQSLATAGLTGRVIEISLLQARGHALQGDLAAAVGALERALTLAEPEGYVRTFVDEGPLAAALLKRLKRDSKRVSQAYVDKLLAAFGDEEALQIEPEVREPRAAAPATPLLESLQLVEPLSERELEVLQLIAAGLSNREIAEELVLATSTVKRHISNIYGKLDVSSRTQALVRARELRLI